MQSFDSDWSVCSAVAYPQNVKGGALARHERLQQVERLTGRSLHEQHLDPRKGCVDGAGVTLCSYVQALQGPAPGVHPDQRSLFLRHKRIHASALKTYEPPSQCSSVSSGPYCALCPDASCIYGGLPSETVSRLLLMLELS